MEILLHRLNQTRGDILNFDLSVHELCLADAEVLTAMHQFTPGSPDEPFPYALLFPTSQACEAAKFDPLDIVLQTAAAIDAGVARTLLSNDGPLPSYFVGGREVTRRFDCVLVFREDGDRCLPVEEESLNPPEEGC